MDCMSGLYLLALEQVGNIAPIIDLINKI